MAWWWAGLVEAGMTLGCLLAPLGQTEIQACTQVQNRICVCEPGWYCTLKRQEGCRQCVRHRKCPPGSGVVKPGMAPGPVGLSFMGINSSAQLGNVVSGSQVPAAHLSTCSHSSFPPAFLWHLLWAGPWGSRDGSN